MKLKVYHATGTIFLKSIKLEGLKAVDIKTKFNTSNFLKLLLNSVPLDYKHDKYHDFVNDVHTSYYTIEDFINQDKELYQHGDLYANTSLSRTKEFAISRTKGSELLTYCYSLYKFCKKHNWFDSSISEENLKELYSELFKVFDTHNLPVVLAFETDISSIRSESGSERKGYTDWLQECDSSYLESVGESVRINLKQEIQSNDIYMHLYDGEQWSEPINLIDYCSD